MRSPALPLEFIRPAVSFSEKIARLGARLQDPQWRRYGLTLLAGKMLGLCLLLFVILAYTAISQSPSAPADDAMAMSPTTQPTTQPTAAVDPYVTTKGGDIINPLNTV